MLTAKQAREIKAQGPSEAEVKKVEQYIKAAAGSSTYCFYYSELSPEMERVLKQNGYAVERMPDRKGEGPATQISWEDNSARDYYNK